MKKKYLICGSKLFSILCVSIVGDDDPIISLLMRPRRRSFLNRFISHGSRIEFALEHNTNTTFFGDHVNALVATLHGHTSIPSGTAQLFRTKRFEFTRGHII